MYVYRYIVIYSLIFVSLLHDTSIRSNFQHGHLPMKNCRDKPYMFSFEIPDHEFHKIATPIKLRRYGSSSCVT